MKDVKKRAMKKNESELGGKAEGETERRRGSKWSKDTGGNQIPR